MADLTLRGQREQALSLVRAGEPVAAVSICQRLLTSYPLHAEAYAILGQAYLQLGKHEEAANLFRRALGVNPEHALCYAGLAVIFEERGLVEEALWQLSRALELSPGNREIRRQLRRLAEEHSALAMARIEMTRGGLARIYLRGQLFAKAIGELRELVDADAQRFDLHIALAEALWYRNDWGEVERICEALLGELPNCLKANLILGQVWLGSERDDRARELLSKAQSFDPENATAQVLFGSRSPLPLRVIRLPWEDTLTPGPDLPYLDRAESAGSLTVDGRVSGAAGTSEISGGPTDRGAPISADAPTAAPPDDELDDLAWIEAQYGYLKIHTEDHAARLALARTLGHLDRLEEAAEQYRQLTASGAVDIAEIARDLELLNRVHPGCKALKELLAVVEEMESASQEGAPLGQD